jgi:large subunit ribosomal protein L21
MYAVIQTGGKQYRIKEGDVFFVEKLSGETNHHIIFDRVLLISNNGSELQVGTPYIENAKVACEIVEQFRGKKILVYKFKRRKKYRRRQGHRQYHTRLRVLEIAPDGQIVGKRPSTEYTVIPDKISEIIQTAPDTTDTTSDTSVETQTQAQNNSGPVGFETSALASGSEDDDVNKS